MNNHQGHPLALRKDLLHYPRMEIPEKEGRSFCNLQDGCSKLSSIKLYWLQSAPKLSEDYSRNANSVLS